MAFSLDGFIVVLVLSLCVSSISVTITKTKIFQGFREFIKKRSQSSNSISAILFSWLGDLFGCPYCASHWIALPFFIIYHPTVIDYSIVIDYLVSFFSMIALAAFWSLIICNALMAMEQLGKE